MVWITREVIVAGTTNHQAKPGPAADVGGGAHHHGHDHGHEMSADADRRWLAIALGLIVGFMATEVIVGLVANSLALISDAGHMFTDAASIALALTAIRLARRPAQGRYTYGFQRVEILCAQANGISLLLLAVWFLYEGVRRLVAPPQVAGPLVLITAVIGIIVNIAATWAISRANRSSLNVEGAFQHILNDLYAFIATAIAGAVVWLTGFTGADAIAALVVAGLMVRAGWGLVGKSGQVFLEAAPVHLDPAQIGARLVAIPQVVEVHDLHVWQISSGQPPLSAHVLVADDADCHVVRACIETLLHHEFGLEHTTLQVDHASDVRASGEHCAASHGPVHRR
jgi:cobalt-zinc-cadmium efflux system protein